MLPLSGLLFLACALALGYFAYHRYTFYRQEPKNIINKYYFVATLSITIGFLVYAAPSLFFFRHREFSVLSTQVATFVNSFAFGIFLLIPAYTWLATSYYTLVRYAVYLYSLFVGILLILYPPHPLIDTFGITHWGFQKPVTAALLGLLVTAFVLNIVLLSSYFKTLRSLSLFNVVALIITFSLAGFGGAYQYIGNDHTLLLFADFALVIGMFVVFITAIKNKV